jgi:hypothetical protein
MTEPQFIRSTAPHIVEVGEGSRNAKSKSATIGTDVQRASTNSTVFVDADLPIELRTLFLDEQSTDSKEQGQENTAARSTSAKRYTDGQLIDSDETTRIDADPPAELKTVFFDQQGTLAARASPELDLAEVHPSPSSSASAPPAIAASADVDKPDKKPIASEAQLKSHFSDQIGELKAKNDRVRSELKRRESATFTKT